MVEWQAERSQRNVEVPTTIVAHLAPDLDCIAAIWIFKRFGDSTIINAMCAH